MNALPERDDRGFTLVEVIVSLGILTLVMTSLTVFMTNSRRAGRYSSLEDSAVQVAVEGMEKARGVRGSALLSGRGQCVAQCAAVVSPRVSSLLGTGVTRWDAAGSGTLTVPQLGSQPDGSVVATPAEPEVVQLDGRWFKRYYYLGACWQPVAAVSAANIACGTSSSAAALVRLVVAVTWSDAQCAGGTCAYATAGLFSSAVTDPYLA
jgi:prepilin-type N-terminal cleavage/methylation domain-containing protein